MIPIKFKQRNSIDYNWECFMNGHILYTNFYKNFNKHGLIRNINHAKNSCCNVKHYFHELSALYDLYSIKEKIQF